MLRKLVLHVGLHKTATSYFQHLFLNNSNLLAESGVALAPMLNELDGTHHKLAAILRDQGADKFLEKFDDFPEETALVTSETLSHILLRDESCAKDLARLSREKGIEIRLVMMIRRQDLLKESVFSEVVKVWYAGSILNENHYDYDFDHRLRKFEAVFGIENIQLGVYRDDGKMNLIGFIKEALELSFNNDQLVPVPRKNVGMHRRKTLFLSEYPKQNKNVRDIVKRTVECTSSIENDAQKFIMSPSERRQFLEQHLEGNESLVSRFNLSDGDILCTADDINPDWKPPMPISKYEYMQVMNEALQRLLTRKNLSRREVGD